MLGLDASYAVLSACTVLSSFIGGSIVAIVCVVMFRKPMNITQYYNPKEENK